MADVSKETLQQTLDNIAAKNKQIVDVRNLQNETQKLKDKVGRKEPKRVVSSASRIQGLQTLKNTLGTQNMKTVEKQ